MTKEKPLLEIQISGPHLKSGRIPVPLLVKLCENAQETVTKQGLAIEGRLRKGVGNIAPPTLEELTLELIGLKKGSTRLQFDSVSKQTAIPGTIPLSVEAVNGVATTLRILQKKRGKWTPSDDTVLDALDKLGTDAFSAGVKKLKWVARSEHKRRAATAEIVPATLAKIKRRKQQSLRLEEQGILPTLEEAFVESVPAPIQGVLEGMLEITDGKARIRPVIGAPTIVHFGADQAEHVLGAAHKPVRVRIDPKARKIVNIELASSSPSQFSGSFFEAKTIEELAAEQHIQPLADLGRLAGAIPDEDIDAFIEEIYSHRSI